jgi:hypothetical protein
MRVARACGAIGLTLALTGACANPFGRQYEYEEQYYLDANGGVTVVVDASVPALVALRGVALDPAPAAHTDRAEIRKQFEAAGCTVVRVAAPWRRNGRRFIQVSIQADDVRELSKCGILTWSTFSGLVPETDPAFGPVAHYRQTVGEAAGGNPGAVNWDGTEIVAVKLHLPSRIFFQNARRLEDGTVRDYERGNIVTWEQRLTDRLAGKPIEIDVKMSPQSILHTTLWLFAGAFAAAVLAMMGAIWWIVKNGKKRQKAEGKGQVGQR